jgi:GT2 family glycosyltransferase
MKLTFAVICFNQLESTKQVWGSFLNTIEDKENTELLVIDNGSTDGTSEWITRFMFPSFPDHRIIRNEENLGVIPALNQVWKEAKGDVVACTHNDLVIYEKGWDKRVLDLFERRERCGLAGFFGAEGCGTDGGRMGCHCNFLEAEIHATRNTGEKQVTMFDGISLIWRKQMMDEINGLDTSLQFHHFYDKNLSLQSHFAGWENWYLGVACHHLNGLTANRPDYQTWAEKKMGTTNFTGDLVIYKANEKRFLNNWRGKLPVIIRS